MDYLSVLPVDIRDKLRFSRTVQAQHYKLSRWVESTGRHILKKREVRVLQFIIARTVPYGKTAERILATHFQKGVFDEKTGACIQARWGGNNDDWYSAVKILEQHDMIIVHPVNAGGRALGTIYEIALDFILRIDIPGEDMTALRQPRKARTEKQQPATAQLIDFGAVLLREKRKLGCSLSDTRVPFLHVQKGTREQEEVNLEIEEYPSAPSACRDEEFSSTEKPVRRNRPATSELDCNTIIRKAIDVAESKSRAARERRVDSAGIGSSATCSERTSAWKQAVLDAQGQCTVIGLTRAEYGRLKSSIKAHTITFTWYDFFSWCVSSWSMLNKLHQENAERRKAATGDRTIDRDSIYLGSSTPQIGKVVINIGKLLRAYTEATNPKAAKSTDTAPQEAEDVARLREELERLRAENARLAATVRKTRSTRTVRAPIRSTPVPSRVLSYDPAEDDAVFDDDDLPEWQ